MAIDAHSDLISRDPRFRIENHDTSTSISRVVCLPAAVDVVGQRSALVVGKVLVALAAWAGHGLQRPMSDCRHRVNGLSSLAAPCTLTVITRRNGREL
jgi:hypothetical protein